MGKVRVKKVSKASADALFDLGMQVVECPEIFPNICDLKVVERKDGGLNTTAEWTAKMKVLGLERKITWHQLDEWSRDEMCCKFSLSPGKKSQMKKMSGKWTFKQNGGDTEMVLDMDFKVNHPLATPKIHKMIDNVMKKNHESLLKAVSCSAEEGCEKLKP